MSILPCPLQLWNTPPPDHRQGLSIHPPTRGRRLPNPQKGLLHESFLCFAEGNPRPPTSEYVLGPSSTSRKILRKVSLSSSIVPHVSLTSRYRGFLCGQPKKRVIHPYMDIRGEKIIKDWRLGRNPGIFPTRIGGEEDKASKSSWMMDAMHKHQMSK